MTSSHQRRLLKLQFALVGTLLFAATAASGGSEGSIWTEIIHADASASDQIYEREMLTGEINTSRAVIGAGANRRTLINKAILAYENASKTKPSEAEPHYRAAELLYAYHVGCPGCLAHPLRRITGEKMLDHWRAFARKAPLDPRVTATLFSQALVHTKLASTTDLQQALESYRMLIDRSDLAGSLPRNSAVWYANMAETHMMLNQLDEAIEQYQRALDIDPEPSYQYGLAVALDRDGQAARAMEMARRGGEASLAVFIGKIEDGSSFYVPDGEHHYYLGVAFRALGQVNRSIEEFQLYLNSGAHPFFQPRAKEHILELTQGKRR